MGKSSKDERPKGRALEQNAHISDPRFANIHRDPRFRLPSKRDTHVQLDKRFTHMLRDDSFSSKAKVDRYGRKLPNGTGRKELEKFYRIDEDEDVERELERVNEPNNAKAQSVLEDQEEEMTPSSDSSSEDGSDEESETDEEEEEIFGIIEEEGAEGGEIPKGEVTSRLAVVNLDWDNIRSSDLMAVFSSFLPSNGQLQKVTVYPSQFGKERMEQEETEGPPKEIFAQSSRNEMDLIAKHPKDDPSLSDSNDDEEDEEDEHDEVQDERIKKAMLKEDNGIDFDSAKLRRYQLERLRYYYAVLDCSSTAVAQAIYNAVDGTEYLSTANFFDLRYIPDDTDFSEDKPRDECSRIPDGYRPNEFVTDALQHSKVKLTWDADDGARKEAQKRAFARSRKDINEEDLKVYLGSDSSDDNGYDVEGVTAAASEPVIVVDATSEDHMVDQVVPAPDPGTTLAKPLSKKAAERQRMRALLGLDPEPARRKSHKSKDKDGPPVVGDMQITFTSGFSTTADEQAPGRSVFENAPEPEDKATTVEKYVRRERERKARRREKAKGKRVGGGVSEAGATQHPTGPDNTNNKEEGREEEEASTVPTGFDDTNNKEEGREEEEASTVPTGFDDPFFASDPDDAHPAPPHNAAKKRKKLHSKPDLVSDPSPLSSTPPPPTPKFTLNVSDARFTAVHDRPDYAIDPSHPRFQDTAGMRALLAERAARAARRRGEPESEPGAEPEQAAKKRRRMGTTFPVDDGRDGDGDNDDNETRRKKNKKKQKRRKEGKLERRGMGKR